ncbi:MAG TPA: T9SS type A sorting domain-containing protein, partial [Cytophagaceae bacterium]|nr:T9SS type A sorting domain-containing protein [Cytophagaceae bacterium]
TTLIGTDNTSPYSFVWSNVVAGNYSVTAKATDNSGAVSTSASVSVVVTNAGTTTTTNTCSGVAQYVENNGYVAGSTVQSGGVIYQCKPYPYTGWCNGAAWAYGPGTGASWTDAWIQMGTCSNVRVSAMNSVSSSSAVSTIQLVPNPTTGVFTISTGSNAAVQVLNSYGEEVLSVNEVAANGSVDITALSAGVYFVKIISADGNLTIQKIVKQ